MRKEVVGKFVSICYSFFVEALYSAEKSICVDIEIICDGFI